MTFEGWSTLRHRDFALLCGARFAVTLALHICNVAVAWYIYDVTASAYALGLLGLAGLLPAIVLVLVTGYAADRIDRKLILFASDAVLTLTGLMLLWLIADRNVPPALGPRQHPTIRPRSHLVSPRRSTDVVSRR